MKRLVPGRKGHEYLVEYEKGKPEWIPSRELFTPKYVERMKQRLLQERAENKAREMAIREDYRQSTQLEKTNANMGVSRVEVDELTQEMHLFVTYLDNYDESQPQPPTSARAEYCYQMTLRREEKRKAQKAASKKRCKERRAKEKAEKERLEGVKKNRIV